MDSPQEVTRIFLVRHGESADHEIKKRQTPTSKLGVNGIKQARALAKRLTKEKIDVILASHWDRANETAEIVGKKLKIKVENYPGIHEKEQNPIVLGVDIDSDIQRRYESEADKYGWNLDWKFEGKGESLRDLIKRAQKFQKHIFNSHKNQSVLVVSHGLFIRAFVITTLLNGKFDDETFLRLYYCFSTNNTGITLLEYNPERKRMELKYMNDHLHLK